MIVVVGIGADGMDGLAPKSSDELRKATVVFGSPRQLGLLDDTVTAERREWPSPMLPALPTLFDGIDGDVHVVASGDPMLHGVGVTLIRIFGADRVTVLPHVSSVALACARLGWPVQTTEVISLVSADLQTALRHGGRAIVLSSDRTTPKALAALLEAYGHGDSELTLLEELGGPGERRRDAIARDWANAAPTSVNDLNVVAVHYLPDERVAWLPDDAFAPRRSDHQTVDACRHPRRAGPPAGGAAVGRRVGIGQHRHRVVPKRARLHRGRLRAPTRRADCRSASTRPAFGAPARRPRRGTRQLRRRARSRRRSSSAAGSPRPGLLDACFDAPARRRWPTGRQRRYRGVGSRAGQWYSRVGGELRRFQHYRGEPVGSFTSWRPAMPVTQWSVVKS